MPSKPQADDKAAQAKPEQIQPATPPRTTPVGVGPKIHAPEDQPVGNEPTEYERGDLGFQARMAEASEKQARYLLWEVGLLVVTVGLAWWAALQARDAARSSRFMLDSQKIGQRAWVATEGFQIRNIKPGTNPVDFDGFQFRYNVKNSGMTPANNVRMLGDIKIVDPGTDVATLEFGGTVDANSRNSLGPGRQFLGPKRRIKTADIYESAYGRKAIYTWVRIEYDDIFGVKHETEATGLFEYFGKAGSLKDPDANPEEFKFSNTYVGPRNFIK